MSDPAPSPVFGPASFVGLTALAYADTGGLAVRVEDAHPLPVSGRTLQARSTPLSGSASASAVAGPFAPELGRPVALRLSGSWTGSVTVKDSLDGGTTKLPLTAGGQAWGGPYSANVNEEEVKTPLLASQTFWLDMTIASGTLIYWMGQ